MRQPEDSGHGPIAAGSHGPGNGRQISAQRQNAMSADQTDDLDREGRKGDQINGAQQPQKQPFHLGEPQGQDALSKGEPREMVEKIAMTGNQAIGGFGDGSKAGDALVDPE